MLGRGAPIAGLAAGVLAIASCSTQRAASPPPRPVPAQPGPIRLAPAQSPSQYVAAAGSIDLFVVRASELALGRSTDEGVRALARRLAEEHRGLAAQLSMAGRRLDALPAARLLAREQDLLAVLDREQRFDSAYRRAMAAAHVRSWEAHARFAANGASATLRPVALNGERVERRHLALLGMLPS